MLSTICSKVPLSLLFEVTVMWAGSDAREDIFNFLLLRISGRYIMRDSGQVQVNEWMQS